MVDTLFTPGGTANGTFKRRKNDIIFYRPNGEPFAALVRLDKAFPWFVSCSKHDGKPYFNHGLAESDKAMLGLADLDRKGIEAEIEKLLEK